MTEKSVPVIRLRDGVPGPVGGLCIDKNDRHTLIPSFRLAPYVPVSLRIFAGASRLLKPWMLVRSMIQDQFDDDAYSPAMSRREECLEIFQRPITCMNRNVVCN